MGNNLSKDLFKNIVGQNHAISILLAAIEKNRIAPAYLFQGPEGVGKKIIARRFLEGLLNHGEPDLKKRLLLENRNHPDLLWIEPTYIKDGKLIPISQSDDSFNQKSLPQIRLEQIKEIKKFLSKKTLEAPLGMVIVESIESIAESSANAFLKTLEEPNNGILILLSSRPEKLLPTIRSRCQCISFKRINKEQTEQILLKLESETDINIAEGLKIKELRNLANGSPGYFIEQIKAWNQIPKGLWSQLSQLPQNPIDALSLARDITKDLDFKQQLWLVLWLEQSIWNEKYDKNSLKILESLRKNLTGYVQPRLAWEVALLRLSE